MKVRFLAVLSTFCLVSAGCNQALPTQKFEDIILQKQYAPKFGDAVGLKAIYCVYGKDPSGLRPGIAQGMAGGRFLYRIKELLDQNKNLQTAEALKAEALQEEQLAKVKP